MRRALGVLSLIAAGALLFALWRARGTPSREAAPAAPLGAVTERVAPVEPAPIASRDSAPAASAAPSASAGRAESVLRELERLSVTDKALALEKALAADRELEDAGVFAEARKALIVTLLVDTNRMAEARERTRAFLTRYPESPYRPLVQGVTGIHPRPRPSESRDAHR